MNRKSEGTRGNQVPADRSALGSKDAGKLVQGFQQLDANPDTSRKDYLLNAALQDAKIDGINTGVPLGCGTEERLAAYQRVFKFQLIRELSLPADASDAEVAKAMNREINRAVREVAVSEKKSVVRRERQYLGLSESASQEELAQARKQPATNQRRRYGLPEHAKAADLEAAMEEAQEEALRIYLGLPKDASEADVLRVVQEEMALYEDTPAEDARLLLGLTSICADETVDEAMNTALDARRQRFHAANERELTERRMTAAQHARRHVLGLAEDASEYDIAMADSDAVYTLRRRNLDLPEDAPAWLLEQTTKQRIQEQPLAVSPMIGSLPQG
jgi:hypothetical protein